MKHYMRSTLHERGLSFISHSDLRKACLKRLEGHVVQICPIFENLRHVLESGIYVYCYGVRKISRGSVLMTEGKYRLLRGTTEDDY